jgi:ring-1,2-phenylacetyl-CoA epoxidase subunit PaaE
MNKISLSIVDIKKETEDATTICFKQPGIRKVKYQAGQYLTLILRINGRQYLRPYSFSSAPSVDKLLEITVKRIELGIVSNFICNNLKIGDVVEAIEPMGDFVYNPLKSTKNIFLWGVGSGITPLYSILKELLNGQIISHYNIHLVYGNKDQKSTIFHDNLKSLQSKFSDNFKITNFYSRGNLDVDIESNKIGRINKDYINNLFSEGKLNDSFHFICGPNALKELITNC